MVGTPADLLFAFIFGIKNYFWFLDRLLARAKLDYRFVIKSFDLLTDKEFFAGVPQFRNSAIEYFNSRPGVRRRRGLIAWRSSEFNA
jgi:hypothetical protein